MEDWVSIKNIKAKNPKLGTRKIAELLGISRNTVKKLLRVMMPRYINAELKSMNK